MVANAEYYLLFLRFFIHRVPNEQAVHNLFCRKLSRKFPELKTLEQNHILRIDGHSIRDLIGVNTSEGIITDGSFEEISGKCWEPNTKNILRLWILHLKIGKDSLVLGRFAAHPPLHAHLLHIVNVNFSFVHDVFK